MNLPVKIQGYQFLKQIGQGATAYVYQARELKSNQKVAIKKMKKMGHKDVQMMKEQIQTMKKFDHDNIVKFINQFKDQNGQWYVVLQYCQYGDLQSYKKKVGKVPQFHVKIYAKGIIQGLKAMHKKDIAHRDLKLSNILIGKNYRLKLADFGFSKNCNKDMISFIGTPLAMAPQIVQRTQYTNKCDIWAFGVLVYMLIYSKAPFIPKKSDGTGFQAIKKAILRGDLIFDPNVKVSKQAINFIRRCLSVDQSNRPSSNQLDKDVWFQDLDYKNMSVLRVGAISQAIKQEPHVLAAKAQNMAKQMLFGSFDYHLKKLSSQMYMNVNQIVKIIKNLNLFYSDSKILYYYLCSVLKRLQQFSKRQILYIINNQNYKLELINIKLFKQYQRQIVSIIEQYNIIQTVSKQKVNIQRQICKFIIQQSQKMLQLKNEDQLDIKINLLKNLSNFMLKDYHSTSINIRWGGRNDLQKYSILLVNFFQQINSNSKKILDMINQKILPDGDLQTIWLIEQNIKDYIKQKKSTDIQLIKLCNFVLNQPSMFKMQKQQQHIQMQQYLK